MEAASRQSVWDVTTRTQRTHSTSNPNGQTVMSVRSSVFESLTASVAVTRSNVIGSYTAETDTHSPMLPARRDLEREEQLRHTGRCSSLGAGPRTVAYAQHVRLL